MILYRTNSSISKFLNLLHCYNFQICNNSITRPKSNTCIDHIITNSEFTIKVSTIDVDISDHLMLKCYIGEKAPQTKYTFYTKFVVNQERIKEEMAQKIIASNYKFENVNSYYNKILDDIKSIVDKNTFQRNCKIETKYLMAPWINSKVLKLIYN